MKLLNKGHASVLKAVSTDETRYMLNGVHLEETKQGLKAVATDGKILAIVEDVSAAIKVEDFPANVMPKDAENSAKSATVPTEAIESIIKALPKNKRYGPPVLQSVAVIMGSKHTTLGVTDLESPTVKVATNIEGVFPNHERVIPKGKPTLTIKFAPGLMIRACQIANSFGLDAMKLEFTDNFSPVKITGNKNGQSLTVLVMPMQPDREVA